MNRFGLASLALLLVAALGTTGCGHRRYHARYAYVPVHVRAAVYYAPQSAPPEAPPPVEAPPQEASPPAAVAPHGSPQVVVHAHAPTTVIVVNPQPGAPAVGVVQGAPPPMRPRAAPAPQPEAPQPENGWFEGE
jgi:hypothetical protein